MNYIFFLGNNGENVKCVILTNGYYAQNGNSLDIFHVTTSCWIAEGRKAAVSLTNYEGGITLICLRDLSQILEIGGVCNLCFDKRNTDGFFTVFFYWLIKGNSLVNIVYHWYVRETVQSVIIGKKKKSVTRDMQISVNTFNYGGCFELPKYLVNTGIRQLSFLRFLLAIRYLNWNFLAYSDVPVPLFLHYILH